MGNSFYKRNRAVVATTLLCALTTSCADSTYRSAPERLLASSLGSYKSSNLNCGATSSYNLTAQQGTISGGAAGATYFTYNGVVPGETLCVLPGESLEIQLTNSLDGITEDDMINFTPALTGGGDSGAPINNTDLDKLAAKTSITNMHTHGLHVSPSNLQDNVLLQINPGKTANYKIDLPSYHAPGTHWYHAHLHGGTAVQVQGGMAGPIIVQETAQTKQTPIAYLPLTHEYLVLKQNGEGYVDSSGSTKSLSASDKAAQKRVKTKAKLLERLQKLTKDNRVKERVNKMSDETLAIMERELQGLISITDFFMNGKLNLTKDDLVAGDIVRLRFINTGSRNVDVVNLYMDGVDNADMWLAAVDGVNLTGVSKEGTDYVPYNEANPLEMGPGNRADFYVVFNEAGTYELKSGTGTSATILMTFVVTAGSGNSTDVDQFVTALDDRLVTLGAEGAYDNYLKSPVSDTVNAQRTISMNVLADATTVPTRFGVNNRTYDHGTDYLGYKEGDGGTDPNNPAATHWPLVSGTTEAWKIVSQGAQGHPYHIHVSPFWVQAICSNNPATIEGCTVDTARTEALDRWQDTLYLPTGYSAFVRYRIPADNLFQGVFVLHCHFLQHEDRGLMMNSMIVGDAVTDPVATFEAHVADNDAINQAINGTAVSHSH